jgi:heme oxygenase (biliverdin-IX-beta and delta-forming)
LLGLPSAIRSRDDYIAWLGRFLGLYEPLENRLAEFSQWGSVGLSLQARTHTSCLLADLQSLGVSPQGVPRASLAMLPQLSNFPQALGALYVLEGATLGGRIILGEVRTWLSAAIVGATSFLGGRGELVGSMWQEFRVAADRFGCERPELRADVVSGAKLTFAALLVWFAPFCNDSERRR